MLHLIAANAWKEAYAVATEEVFEQVIVWSQKMELEQKTG